MNSSLITYKKEHSYVPEKEIYRSEENATVFLKARDAETGRAVGIKKIKASDRRLLKEYENEVKALIKLEKYSRSIPTVYDYFTDKNEITIIMSYIEGKTLAEVMANERDRVYTETVTRNNLRRLKSLAHVLGEIHRFEQAQHKDLKPANIILKSYKNREELFVIDFGLTGVLNYRGTGTLFYQAPEQSELFRGMVSPDRIDVFSFGLIAYELLEGRRLKFLEDLVLDPAKSEWKNIPDIKNPYVNRQVNNVIKKCLAYDPKNRYKNGERIEWELKKATK